MMVWSARQSLYAVALSLATACGGTSDAEKSTAAPDPGLPPGSARLVDLSDDEALRLCTWQSERLHYGYCLQNGIILRDLHNCQEYVDACTAPDVVAGLVVDCVESTLDPAKSCETTVTDVERCTLDLQAQYAGLPACDRVTDAAFHDVLYRMSPASCEKLRCPVP